jgi:outer membrane protein TolC
MQLERIRVFEGQNSTQQDIAGQRQAKRKMSGGKLRAIAAIMLTMAACVPQGFAAQTPAGSTGPEKSASNLPPAPAPTPTEPFDLNRSARDFSQPYGRFWSNPINKYRPTTIAKGSFENSVRLNDLIKDGKLYLSLSDAIALALENNYDIAIARYDLSIADSDILRTKTGNAPLGVNAGVIQNTLGGTTTSVLQTGGGPGGTSVSSGGAASGASGLTLTTAGAGPAPENLDPYLAGTVSFDRDHTPSTSFFTTGTSSTNTYNFSVAQGFVTGTNLQIGFNNSYASTNNTVTQYSPLLSSNIKAQVTQHLLQGAGIFVNKRFIYEALNDRRIVDSSFREQILYTVNQVETIYWGLVQAYEDVQAKQHALDQSQALDSDDRKQLQIGTVAPLQVVQDDSAVATDKQALISSQNTLNYQQQIIKQAIARNLNDAALSAAPVIPTDRVSIEEIPEETQPVEALVQEAFQRRPELEQAVLTLRNDEITLKGARNALLPTFDIYGYLTGQGVAGSVNKNLNPAFCGATCPSGSSGYGTALGHAFNDSARDQGIGFNIQIPLRNRYAQSVQERSLMEYRQAELRLAQLYTQIRMQVVNARFALTNDRAVVQADLAARDYANQSVNSEITKLHLGASTTANVLLQQRTLAIDENNLIAAQAAYANARASLFQTLATTLQHYGINLPEAASGDIKTTPVVTGVKPAPAGNEPSLVPPNPNQAPPPAANQPAATPPAAN